MLESIRHKIEPDETLKEYLVFEGRADFFAKYLYPDAHCQWTQMINKEQEKYVWNLIKPELNNRNREIIDLMMIGNEKIPYGSGYSIGYNIVANFMTNNPQIKIIELTDLSPKEILNRSEYDTYIKSAWKGFLKKLDMISHKTLLIASYDRMQMMQSVAKSGKVLPARIQTWVSKKKAQEELPLRHYKPNNCTYLSFDSNDLVICISGVPEYISRNLERLTASSDFINSLIVFKISKCSAVNWSSFSNA